MSYAKSRKLLCYSKSNVYCLCLEINEINDIADILEYIREFQNFLNVRLNSEFVSINTTVPGYLSRFYIKWHSKWVEKI